MRPVSKRGKKYNRCTCEKHVILVRAGSRMGLKVRKSGHQTPTCNLFCKIAAKRVEQRCCAFKPVFQQSSLLQVAKSCCRKQRVVLFLATKSEKVARFTGLRQTCFALSDVVPVYTVTPLFYYSRNLQDRFERGW